MLPYTYIYSYSLCGSAYIVQMETENAMKIRCILLPCLFRTQEVLLCDSTSILAPDILGHSRNSEVYPYPLEVELVVP